jgi:pSer/pThr/pTyr-binding forkhead associated (FHA) protein
MPHVLIIIDHGEERRFEIISDLTTMGRSPENDIQISDSLASRFHCQFERTPEGLKLVDLESQNGTNVNGKKVNSKKLTTDDLVEIGDVTIQLSLEPQTAGLRPLRRKRSRKVAKRRRPRISAPAENDLDDRFSTLLVEIHKDLGNEGLQQAESIFQDFLESEDGGRLRTIEEQRNKLEGLVEINKAINSELDKSRLLNKIMGARVYRAFR